MPAFAVWHGGVYLVWVHPHQGYNGNSKIDPQYLDFWYRQQILPAYAGYLAQVKRLDEIAGELEKYPEN